MKTIDLSTLEQLTEYLVKRGYEMRMWGNKNCITITLHDLSLEIVLEVKGKTFLKAINKIVQHIEGKKEQ